MLDLFISPNLAASLCPSVPSLDICIVATKEAAVDLLLRALDRINALSDAVML